MQGDIKAILIHRESIAARVRELARSIAACYGEQEIVIMPVLTGSIIFLADLVRHMPQRMRIDVVAVSSYAGAAAPAHAPAVLYPTDFDVSGRHVLVVDDILDSGRTLKMIKPMLLEKGAISVRTCVLLRKQIADVQHCSSDFVGFEIPNVFVVGYGLDYNNFYRNLPDIAVLHDHVIARR